MSAQFQTKAMSVLVLSSLASFVIAGFMLSLIVGFVVLGIILFILASCCKSVADDEKKKETK